MDRNYPGPCAANCADVFGLKTATIAVDWSASATCVFNSGGSPCCTHDQGVNCTGSITLNAGGCPSTCTAGTDPTKFYACKTLCCNQCGGFINSSANGLFGTGTYTQVATTGGSGCCANPSPGSYGGPVQVQLDGFNATFRVDPSDTTKCQAQLSIAVGTSYQDGTGSYPKAGEGWDDPSGTYSTPWFDFTPSSLAGTYVIDGTTTLSRDQSCSGTSSPYTRTFTLTLTLA